MDVDGIGRECIAALVRANPSLRLGAYETVFGPPDG